MNHNLSPRSDHELIEGVKAKLREYRENMAQLLATLAEFDARRLHAPAYETMEEYCVRELNYPEDEAEVRILAARAARRFPDIFPAIADGRLEVAAVAVIAPYLTEETGDDLLIRIEGPGEPEVRRRVSERFGLRTVPLAGRPPFSRR